MKGQRSRAPVLPQNRLSHMQQQIRNFLFYFYCKTRGRLLGKALSRCSRLAAHERGSGWGPAWHIHCFTGFWDADKGAKTALASVFITLVNH